MNMSLFSEIPDVLEVTLRDGSYVIDFQFTAEDTSTLVTALETVGFRWIEIGHGLGMNARDKGKRLAAASDAEYLEAAAQAAQSARWGMFFIPGIGTEEDLRLAARYKMPFVRIGTNINEAERAQPFIALAKELGMIACYNAMKSYAVTPGEFAQVAAQTQAWGADIVYIVDSAGTMYPEDVSTLIKAIQNTCDVPIGFHGHDNLSLAAANTLQAVESGAVLVDSSLRGMGRSAGNAITEAILALLKRRGYLKNIDLKGVMDVSAGLIEPLIPGRGLDTMSIIAGYAGFHSSFTERVQDYAERYNIDTRDLIVKLCEENRIDAPSDLLERLSIELAQDKQERFISIPAFGLRESGAVTEQLTLDKLFKQLYAEAIKAHHYSALNVIMAESPIEQYAVSPNIQNTAMHTVGAVTVSSEAQLTEVLRKADGLVDVVLLDIDRQPFGPTAAAQTAALLQHTLALPYSDSQTWVEALKNQTISLLGSDLRDTKIVIAGDHRRSQMLAPRLADYGAQVTIMAQDDASFETQLGEARAVIAWPEVESWFGANFAQHLSAGAYLIDAGIGSILPDGIQKAHERGALPIRVNSWPTISGVLISAHESAQVRASALGWEAWEGVPVVAGGAIGEAGAVIVDSIQHPTRIIGVADGRGGVSFQHNPEYLARLLTVTEIINRQRVAPELLHER
jgi:4-hydroxy-2-oxovalerate aldolase